MNPRMNITNIVLDTANHNSINKFSPSIQDGAFPPQPTPRTFTFPSRGVGNGSKIDSRNIHLSLEACSIKTCVHCNTMADNFFRSDSNVKRLFVYCSFYIGFHLNKLHVLCHVLMVYVLVINTVLK